MRNGFTPVSFIVLAAVFWLSSLDATVAHHVLGRPAYSLNEDSNTPPAAQAEVQIGDYLVTYMIFPAFPRPQTPGSISLYATRIDNGQPFPGDVTFKAHVDSWIPWLGAGNKEITLGVQQPDDNVFRQRYQFHEAGDYIVAANFQVDGEPYACGRAGAHRACRNHGSRGSHRDPACQRRPAPARIDRQDSRQPRAEKRELTPQ